MLCTSSQEERSIRDLGYRVPTRVVPLGVDAGALRAPASPRQDPSRLPVFNVMLRSSRSSAGSLAGRAALLVQSFSAMAATFPRAHLIVAGPDDEGIGRALAPKIAAAGVGDRISLVQRVGGSDKRALLQRSDVVVLPSTGESFGLAVAEAMAVGCPVVVSPAVPLSEAVTAAGAGLVVERESAQIAQALGAILSDRQAASEMGQAGRRVIDEQFAWERVHF